MYAVHGIFAVNGYHRLMRMVVLMIALLAVLVWDLSKNNARMTHFVHRQAIALNL
jgi:hypothetical protein